MSDQTSVSPYPDGGGPEGLGGPAGRPLPPGFAEWVDGWFQSTIPEVQAKAREYGSNSLSKKGWRMAQVQGRMVDAPGALRLGVAQYAIEKADRIEDAMMRGAEASADTWKDLAVYALMHAYIADTGTW